MPKRVLFYLLIISSIFVSSIVTIAADVDIVISEIMIDAFDDINGEWVEVYNRGNVPVNLAGWVLQDNNASDTITTDMCPNNDCTIPAGECWVIAESNIKLQTEFSNYSSPPAVDATRSIFIDPETTIGNGLANTGDHLILQNSALTSVDCYSWDGTTVCAGLTYISGGNGVDGSQLGSEGQSVTNIQGSWYDHAMNASPYDCTNTADGTGPTAISLQTISTNNQPTGLLLVTIILLLLTASGIWIRLQKR